MSNRNIAVFTPGRPSRPPGRQPDSGTGLAWTPQLPVCVHSLATYLRLRRHKRVVPASEPSFLLPFHLQARAGGRTLYSGWFESVPFFHILDAVLTENRATRTIEICICTGAEELDLETWRKRLGRSSTGRLGLEALYGRVVRRVAPLESIAANCPLKAWFNALLVELNLSEPEFFARGGRLRVLRMRQFVARVGEEPVVVETYRGNEIIKPESANVALLERVLAGMATWFMANLGPDGRLPYKYWPSRNAESESDNPIRRFMATIALNRLGAALDNPAMLRAARRNLAFNLARFYRHEAGLGRIEWNGSVKLGAVALAGMAILESPAAGDWARELESLDKTVHHLWRRDGAFRTFLIPFERNDNQNFYPGEALLFWASRLEHRKDRSVLDRALRSVGHYRSWFASKPNPAFVPWHTQACAMLYRLTGRSELRDYVFAMNDWLVPHQQWGGDLDPDLWGRFYSPDRPDFGPPHASATGVYMEGMADALALAIESGDAQRADMYERVLWRGLRSIAQLQYRGRIDAFYVERPHRVVGGVRTDADDNEIRIDNIQHALMGLLKLRTVLSGRTVCP